jgi:hypothetical protein
MDRTMIVSQTRPHTARIARTVVNTLGYGLAVGTAPFLARRRRFISRNSQIPTAY